MERPRHLKIRARDLDDMSVMAAMLQDAVVRPTEMTYLRRDKRFVMVISRFRWEDPEPKPGAAGEAPSEAVQSVPYSRVDGPGDGPKGSPEDRPDDSQEDARFEDAGPRPLFERVNAGVCFENVRRVRTQKINFKDQDQVLSLLTVETRPHAFTLVFSGGGLVRLEVSAIACFLEDLGEPWPTPWLPLHEASESESAEAAAGEPGAGE